MKKSLIILLILIITITSCSQQTTTDTTEEIITENSNEISISNFAFNPEELTISIGTTLTWTNLDSAPHTIAFESFESETLNTNDQYSYTFTEAGTYNYYCSLHPSMQGTIIVE